MNLRATITCICAVLIASISSASPARYGRLVLAQPDGSTFAAIMQGDEFACIKTTADGSAIIQEADGWWCYASYRGDGTRTSTGWHVGKETPASVISCSRFIPRSTISGIASVRRKAVSRHFTSQPAAVATKSTTTRHGIVILAQFQDIKFRHGRQDFVNMLTSDGYDRYGATGSAKEYFDAQFSGRLEFSFDVSEIVTLPGKREYYGGNNDSGNDTRPAEMVRKACEAAQAAGTDFSLYDEDADGVVDNVFIFFAGEDEAEGADENSIWSHAWYLLKGAGMTLELDGKLIDRYACSSEMTRIHDEASGKFLESRLCGIGTFCHEYCHTFGLPDLYDTDYDEDGGWAAGLWGSTSIMDSGNQNNHGNTPPNFNAIEREILGLSKPVIIEQDGPFTLEDISKSGKCYRIDSRKEDEYYLLESRSNEGSVWDRYIGGSGMLVYHIDKSGSWASAWAGYNTVNADASHQCADLTEADGRKDSYSDYLDYLTRRKNLEGLFFPYGENDNLTPVSSPGLSWWHPAAKDISITGIRRNGDGSIAFNVIGFSEESTPPRVLNGIEYETFCDGAIINFESSRPFDGEAIVTYGHHDGQTDELRILPYKESHYSVMLQNLDPVRTYTVNISFSLNGIQGEASEVSFMTKKKPAVKWPYLNFGSVSRNNNGTFLKDSRIALKVNNMKGVAEIGWYFNGKEIEHEGDHYYTLSESGTLEARLLMEDGQTMILCKTITISSMSAQ